MLESLKTFSNWVRNQIQTFGNMGRVRAIWMWSVLIFGLVAMFQNCQVSAPARFLSLSSLKSQQSSTSGNGVGVEGKPIGTFVRNVPKYCVGQNKPFGVLSLGGKENVLSFYDLVTCEEKRKPIDPDKVVVSEFDRNIVSLDDGVYEKAEPVVFEREPIAIEAWCASPEKSHLEVHLRRDFKQSKFFAKVYFQKDAKNLVAGPIEIQRTVSNGNLLYKNDSMEMLVDVSMPSMSTFDFKSHFVARLDDSSYDVDLKCRLGADHDGSIWPSMPILSSVENFQMTKDFTKLFVINGSNANASSNESGLFLGQLRDIIGGTGGFVRLDSHLAQRSGSHVFDFKVSPAEDRVVFRVSDQTQNGHVELHAVDVLSGKARKVSSAWSSAIPAASFDNLDRLQIPAVKDVFDFSGDGKSVFFQEESSLVNTNSTGGVGLGFPVLSWVDLESSVANPVHLSVGGLALHQKMLQAKSGDLFINGVSPVSTGNAIMMLSPPFLSAAKVLVDEAMLPQGYQIRGGSEMRLSGDGQVLYFTIVQKRLYSSSLNETLMAFHLSSQSLVTVDNHLPAGAWRSDAVIVTGQNIVIFDGATLKVLSSFGHVLLTLNYSSVVAFDQKSQVCIFTEASFGQTVIKKIDLSSLGVSIVATLNMSFNFGTVVGSSLHGSRLFVLADTDSNGLYELHCIDLREKTIFAVSDRFVEYGGVTRFQVNDDGTEVVFLSYNASAVNGGYLFRWTDRNEF